MKLRDLCNKYRFIPRGIIHVGAHKAEESSVYDDLGIENVVWIEGNPDLANQLKENFNKKHNVVLNYLISDVDDKEFDFKITNNGESSSILELGTHKEKHPQIYVTETKVLKSKTLASVIAENNIDMSNYNFLNLDIQGAELLALKGLGDKINNVDYIYTEVNTNYLYKDCALINDIDEYLSKFGFYRAETSILEQYEWGDAFYVRKKTDNKLDQMLIFDIGANKGDFSEKCLIEYKDVKMITIEANDELASLLTKKFINSDVVVLNNLASSKNNEEIEFFISNADTISTASKDWIEKSRFSNNYSWGDPIKKKTVNIDSLIEKYGKPNLIKIDVEGYELEVVKGLTTKQSEICFEWAEEEYSKINETCSYLKSIGYEEFGFIYGDEHLKRPDVYTSWENCSIHNDININRKDKWGMIWAK